MTLPPYRAAGELWIEVAMRGLEADGSNRVQSSRVDSSRTAEASGINGTGKEIVRHGTTERILDS
jgi:hypothetical protein